MPGTVAGLSLGIGSPSRLQVQAPLPAVVSSSPRRPRCRTSPSGPHRLVAVWFAPWHPFAFRYVTHYSGSAARVAPTGHSLLFAVGARPPQDGVRRARRLNLTRDLEAHRLPAPDSQRDRLGPSFPRERRGSYPRQAEIETPVVTSRPQRRLASPMPQARSADHLVLRISSECAASYSAVRANSSPHRLMPPCTSVSPDW